MNPAKSDRIKRIATLNDELRRSMNPRHGRVMLTAGFAARPINTQLRALQAIRKFDNWNQDNDPWGDHDFCSVEIDGITVFSKISYYDPSYQYHSEDSSDPERTRRVMVVMKSDEY